MALVLFDNDSLYILQPAGKGKPYETELILIRNGIVLYAPAYIIANQKQASNLYYKKMHDVEKIYARHKRTGDYTRFMQAGNKITDTRLLKQQIYKEVKHKDSKLLHYNRGFAML